MLGAAFFAVIGLAQLAAADASHGCVKGFPKPTDWYAKANEARIFKVNDRQVRVTIPTNYKNDTATPVIIAFHDSEQGVEALEYDAAFGEDDINPDAIMVYPQAHNGRWMSELRPLPKNTKSATASGQKNATDDITFMNLLLKDLELLLCIDTTHVFATGLGTGAGMVHLLACDPELSNHFAAFAAVGGAFGLSKNKKSPWSKCKPGRKPIPIAEIHGMQDSVVGYMLAEHENGKTRQIPPHWVEEWAERNGCGDPKDEPFQLKSDEATFVTKLDVGIMSESVINQGGATRIARRCRSNKKLKSLDSEEKGPTLDETDVLHIKLKRYGHGWPRRQLRPEPSSLHDVEIGQDVLAKQKRFFDTSRILMDWFKTKHLPAEHAKRAQAFVPESEGGEALDKDDDEVKKEARKKIIEAAKAKRKEREEKKKQEKEGTETETKKADKADTAKGKEKDEL